MYRTLVAGLLVSAVAVAASTQLQSFRIQPLGQRDLVLQASSVTCGPASLAYILTKRGFSVTQEQIAQLAGTGPDGTTLLGLAQVAESYGATTTVIRGSYKMLKEIDLPAIAVFPDHFVVVTHVEPEFVIVADPLVGFVKYGHKAFNRTWTGQLLVLQWRSVV